MRKIKRNAIRCVYCDDVIESNETDWNAVTKFKWCSCGMVAVAGGKCYVRRLYLNSPDDFEELTEWEDEHEPN